MTILIQVLPDLHFYYIVIFNIYYNYYIIKMYYNCTCYEI